jgi:hypothetical protein
VAVDDPSQSTTYLILDRTTQAAASRVDPMVIHFTPFAYVGNGIVENYRHDMDMSNQGNLTVMASKTPRKPIMASPISCYTLI